MRCCLCSCTRSPGKSSPLLVAPLMPKLNCSTCALETGRSIVVQALCDDIEGSLLPISVQRALLVVLCKPYFVSVSRLEQNSAAWLHLALARATLSALVRKLTPSPKGSGRARRSVLCQRTSIFFWGRWSRNIIWKVFIVLLSHLVKIVNKLLFHCYIFSASRKFKVQILLQFL